MIKIATAAEQAASHLKNELLRGRWTKTMPGRDHLAKELGVDASTIERALGHLEMEGVIQSQGPGKRRLITLEVQRNTATQILIIPYEKEDQHDDAVITELVLRLHEMGHHTSFTLKSLAELKHDPAKVASMMRNHPREACIVIAGSRPILEMAAGSAMPCFALFGRMKGLPIAGTGPSKIPAIRDAVDRLHHHGHRRIVMLVKSESMQHGLSGTQLAFLEELAKRNLSNSDYNLPQWDSTPVGLRKCLEALFQVTPPTAILIDDWKLHFAIQNFLTCKQGAAYRRVACICTDYHPCFKWCYPRISHIIWDPMAACRRVVEWVDHVSKGKKDLRQSLVHAKFIEGDDLALAD